jgi:hypothetical protein
MWRPDLPGELHRALLVTEAVDERASGGFAFLRRTIARAWTDTFAGIAPRDVAPFIIAQLVGAFAGMLVVAALGVPNRISSPLEIQLDSAPDLSAS